MRVVGVKKKKSSAWDNVTTVEARASTTSHWVVITNWENIRLDGM